MKSIAFVFASLVAISALSSVGAVRRHQSAAAVLSPQEGMNALTNALRGAGEEQAAYEKETAGGEASGDKAAKEAGAGEETAEKKTEEKDTVEKKEDTKPEEAKKQTKEEAVKPSIQWTSEAKCDTVPKKGSMHCLCVVGKEGLEAMGASLPKDSAATHAGVCVPGVDASWGLFGLDLFQISCLQVCGHKGSKQDIFAFAEKRAQERDGKVTADWTAQANKAAGVTQPKEQGGGFKAQPEVAEATRVLLAKHLGIGGGDGEKKNEEEAKEEVVKEEEPAAEETKEEEEPAAEDKKEEETKEEEPAAEDKKEEETKEEEPAAEDKKEEEPAAEETKEEEPAAEDKKEEEPAAEETKEEEPAAEETKEETKEEEPAAEETKEEETKEEEPAAEEKKEEEPAAEETKEEEAATAA